MNSQKIIKLMLTESNKSSRDLATAFNTTKAAAATKISKGIYSIKDFLTIAKECGADVNVRLSSGVNIPLTLDDLNVPATADDLEAIAEARREYASGKQSVTTISGIKNK